MVNPGINSVHSDQARHLQAAQSYHVPLSRRGRFLASEPLLMPFLGLGTPSHPFRKPPATSGLQQLEFVCFLSISFRKCELRKGRQAFCLVHWETLAIGVEMPGTQEMLKDHGFLDP